MDFIRVPRITKVWPYPKNGVHIQNVYLLSIDDMNVLDDTALDTAHGVIRRRSNSRSESELETRCQKTMENWDLLLMSSRIYMYICVTWTT